MESNDTSASTSGIAPWIAPAESDSRSPCPALNSLANHGYLDHSGKNLHFTEVLHATKKCYGLDTAMASSLTLGGAIACGHIGLDGAKFDLHELAKHNRIEHDGSLSHGPTQPGGEWAPIVPDPDAIEKTIAHSSDGGQHLTLEDLARARVDAEGDKPLDAIHARIGSGEVALTLLTMGDGERVTTDRVRTWYGEDRLPDDYVPPTEGSVSLIRVNKMVGVVGAAMDAERDKKNKD